jgi:hypothetical protein
VTQEEKLVARLKTLDPSSLYEIVVYVTPDKTIGFWVVEKKAAKLEGIPLTPIAICAPGNNKIETKE